MGKKSLVIIGATEFAEIASDYFSKDSEYEVVAFSVNREFIISNTLKGLPVVPFEELTSIYPPDQFYLFTAITYGRLNRLRESFYLAGKNKGYRFASYISPHSFVWDNVVIGEDSFVFEDNTIQYNARIGDGVVLWSGNHVGHSAIIEDFCFISSHVVISGYCKIGAHSFCGVNAALGNNISIACDSVIAAGAVVTHSCSDPGKAYAGNPSRIISKSAYDCLP